MRKVEVRIPGLADCLEQRADPIAAFIGIRNRRGATGTTRLRLPTQRQRCPVRHALPAARRGNRCRKLSKQVLLLLAPALEQNRANHAEKVADRYPVTPSATSSNSFAIPPLVRCTTKSMNPRARSSGWTGTNRSLEAVFNLLSVFGVLADAVVAKQRTPSRTLRSPASSWHASLSRSPANMPMSGTQKRALRGRFGPGVA
jgi:hypothetical protein